MVLFKRNTYTRAGLSLAVFGVLVLAASLAVLRLNWLSALGLAAVIISFITIALGRTIPRLSPEACRLLLKTGADNMGSLIEELGVRNRAVYLPSSLTGDGPRALIPLDAGQGMPKIASALPRRLIARYGPEPDTIGLLLSTIGTNAYSLLESRPAPGAAGLETSLSSLFSAILGVADRVRVIQAGDRIRVEIHKPSLECEPGWSEQCLGRPLASIAATLAAEAMDRPVVIASQRNTPNLDIVEIEVAP
ncbi:MAG: hypothetical protein HYX96_00830 [Chloroflexi bacterium]|nr:hypothetical protein [Chloroflexota bacterium]